MKPVDTAEVTMTEAIELLEENTGLTFVQNKFNGQIEANVDTWRIAIAPFSDELDTNAETIKTLYVHLASSSPEWATGQGYAAYSVRQGLLGISGWINGFLRCLVDTTAQSR